MPGSIVTCCIVRCLAELLGDARQNGWTRTDNPVRMLLSVKTYPGHGVATIATATRLPASPRPRGPPAGADRRAPPREAPRTPANPPRQAGILGAVPRP